MYDKANTKKRLLKLGLVEEDQDKAVAHLRIYKQRMCQTYNWKVILYSFQVNDVVWKKAQFAGEVKMLKPWWKGPYKIY